MPCGLVADKWLTNVALVSCQVMQCGPDMTVMCCSGGDEDEEDDDDDDDDNEPGQQNVSF